MKAIIQSYTPQECERIINGRQTIKVCKTAPKETPFKVYMYCTKDGYMYRCRFDENRLAIPELWNGKVIGEFVCEKVDVVEVRGKLLGLYNSRFVDASDFSLIVKRYLDNSELSNYGRGKSISCLYISNVKIYDKPKELSEFRKPCLYGVSKCMYDDRPKCYDCDRTITRPPHGWQYVEE